MSAQTFLILALILTAILMVLGLGDGTAVIIAVIISTAFGLLIKALRTISSIISIVKRIGR